MKNIISNLAIIGGLLLLTLSSCKKEGCTDINALNYNAKAKSKPSLCKYQSNDPLGNSHDNYPTLITGSLNFIDDSLIVNYQGISDYFNANDSIIPNVFGWSPSSGFVVQLSSAQFENEERVYGFNFYIESHFDSPLYGDYTLSYENPYIGFSIYVDGKLHGEDNFSAGFPTSNYLNYYKDLNTPINNIEGDVSINFREPIQNEVFTDLSGTIEAVLYYDEEIVLDNNNQEVRVYHKKLIVNMMNLNGKVEVY